MKVTAKLKNLRIAPRKTKLVADLIRGLDADKAIEQLEATIKRSCPDFKKLLMSALANAENNFGLARDNMYICDVNIGAGPTLKRWMPKAFGRAGKIMKRTSRIEIVLEERIEGKGRKTKEEMEKEKAKRAKEREKEEKAMNKEREKEETAISEKVEKVNDKSEKIEEKGKKEVKQKAWSNRIFRRKSM